MADSGREETVSYSAANGHFCQNLAVQADGGFSHLGVRIFRRSQHLLFQAVSFRARRAMVRRVPT